MIKKSQQKRLNKIVSLAREDENLLAVITYGSRIKNSKKETPESDLDICLVLQPGYDNGAPKHTEVSPSRKRLDYLSRINPDQMDVQSFQQLPIYIKKRVLEEGKVEYCKDKEGLYNLAFRTIQEYEDFAPRFREYLEGVRND